MLSKYIPIRTQGTCVRNIRFAKLYINDSALLNLPERLKTEGGKRKNLGISHVNFAILYCYEPDEVEVVHPPSCTSCQWSCRAKPTPPEMSESCFSRTCACSIMTLEIRTSAGRKMKISVRSDLSCNCRNHSTPRLLLLRTPASLLGEKVCKVDLAEGRSKPR